MSALPQSFLPPEVLRYERMSEDNIYAVMAIERSVYPFPWSRNVFVSTLLEGHDCWVARDASNSIVGYFVLMQAVDEAHLLTIAVKHDLHGRGIGRKLLEQVVACARAMPVESILLEVRPSNVRAVDLYEHYGFKEIGRRKNYYQAPASGREDAIVMRLTL
ncbi:MAG: ribosomal-protein-alanine N-acetyltransferase [Oxalobacter sp.]|nr:MAG: ribosomal-protein-alanine N-acetyltransferase [Oxalobacter sp.]